MYWTMPDPNGPTMLILAVLLGSLVTGLVLTALRGR